MPPLSFEAGLSTLFRDDLHFGLTHLSLAERTGFTDRARDWLRHRLDEQPGKRIHFGWLGRQSFDQIVAIWEALRGGNAREIRNVVQAATPDDLESTLSLAFSSVVPALVLLGAHTTIRALHGELPRSLADDFAERAGLDLGACDEWESALAILEQAHRNGANPRFGMANQSLLWKHAYLQGHVETVLPRLAAIPFNRELEHAADARAWQLKCYRIRAGGIDMVPAQPGDQSPGYIEAATMQVAALEGNTAAAGTVRELRAALAPKPIAIHIADRGFSFNLEVVSDGLFKARVRVAAHRRDYAELSRLARMPSPSLGSGSDVVIDALIEEGEWRAAADFADRHDPRDQPVVEGFDDGRLDEYCELQLILAAAAARGGDDALAHSYLSRHVAALIEIRETSQTDGEEEEPWPRPTRAPGLWPGTLLAGAAEGLMPRHFLAMLLPVFRGPY
jgi:hypothetical protein